MDLEQRQKEIEAEIEQLNARRAEYFKQLEFTKEEFLRLEGEHRLIVRMLREASTEENINGAERSENRQKDSIIDI